MSCPSSYYDILERLRQWFPQLRPAQQRGLAWWVLGLLLAQNGTQSAVVAALQALGGRRNTWRQRLREWLYEGAAKAAPCRTQVEVRECFGPWLAAVLSGGPSDTVFLALDATLKQDCCVALSLSLLYRGTALPLAWKLLTANQKGPWMEELLSLLALLQPWMPSGLRVLVLADRGLWSRRLWQRVRAQGWHPLLRIQGDCLFQPPGGRQQPGRRFVSQPGQAWVGQGLAFKAHRLPATLVVSWQVGKAEPCLVLTDLAPSEVEVTWYGLRFWIELGFRVLKSWGWHWERTRRRDLRRTERHWLALAVATWWVLAAGTRAEDAEGLGQPPGRLRQAPSTSRLRQVARSGRTFSLFRRGLAVLSRQLFGRGLWRRWWLAPEPWPGAPPGLALTVWGDAPP